MAGRVLLVHNREESGEDCSSREKGKGGKKRSVRQQEGGLPRSREGSHPRQV